MPHLPHTPAAWTLTLLGVVALGVAVVLHLGMFSVVFGGARVAPGGGEFAVALFGGLPLGLLSCVLLAIVSLRTAWRSTASVLAVCAAAALLLSWLPVAMLWP